MTTPAASFDEVLQGRQTVRRFTPEPVPLPVLERVLAAAARAPSAHNRQPWRFCAVYQPQARRALAEAMGQRLRSDRARDGDAAAVVEADAMRSRERITGAPLAVVVCLTMEEMDTYPDPGRARAESTMAVQSTAMAGAHLLLAAQAEGLGGCWMCAPLFCPDEVRAALSLPASWVPQGLVLLGHPAEPGRSRSRKPMPDILVVR